MRPKSGIILSLLFLLIIGSSGFTDPSFPPDKKATVYIFLSETCPICQTYTLTLKELHKKYSTKGITFVGVFSNYDANPDSVAYFKKKYAVPFELKIDKKAELARRFSAGITPEVFVVDVEGQVLYSGRIDDRFYAVGKRRNVISFFDLDEALSAIVRNEKVKVPKTEAIGCIISISK